MRRAGPARDIPPPLELECLKVLWAMGRANVKDVRDALASRRNLAYTTVMTVLDRLVHKGGVSREKLGRSFVYTPLLTRDGLRRAAVRELLDYFFDGSETALLEYLRRAPEIAPATETRSAAAAAGAEDHHIDTVLL